MENSQYEEIMAMLAVIYKKLSDLELSSKGNSIRIAPVQKYLDDLRKEAAKVSVK